MGKKMSRPDIEPSISLMCTRTTKNTVEDKANMKRVMKLMKQTINDKRVMVTDNSSKLCTWVDAAYGIP